VLTIRSTLTQSRKTLTRRDLLTIGSIGSLGLGLPDFLRQKAQAESTSRGKRGLGTAENIILLYLQGSPSHIDTWDPKPDAPTEIRGEFKPIPTQASGMMLTEVLPKLARVANRFSLIRSIAVKPRGLANHGAAIYMLMTGHDPNNFTSTGLAVPPTREDLPSVGANVARHRPATNGAISYAAIGGSIKEGAVSGVGQGAGLLGAAYDPFTTYEDPTQPLRLESLTLPSDVTLGRLQARIDLRGNLSANNRKSSSLDAFYGKAFSLIESPRAVGAFQLDRESLRLRDRYGNTRFGQSCLLSRRLIESGTRFVQVNWPSGSDTEPEPGPDGSWDTHRNNFPMLKDWRCPVFDQSVSALIDDLHQRGLLDSTLVLAIGEFGRSPKIGSPTTNNVGPGGRDHWPSCYTALIAGGGVQPGQVYGSSDRNGAYPNKSPVHPYDVIATIYHALGIDLAIQYRDTLDRPRGLIEHGEPILGLF
jgi:hypothetical protein